MIYKHLTCCHSNLVVNGWLTGLVSEHLVEILLSIEQSQGDCVLQSTRHWQSWHQVTWWWWWSWWWWEWWWWCRCWETNLVDALLTNLEQVSNTSQRTGVDLRQTIECESLSQESFSLGRTESLVLCLLLHMLDHLVLLQLDLVWSEAGNISLNLNTTIFENHR